VSYIVVSQAPPPDWRPYKATAGTLALSLSLNVWTQNVLWMVYTLAGMAVFAVLVAVVRKTSFRPPTRAMWLFGLTWALHYGGGSLSGLHQIGGLNGLYYVFPWWDNVVHIIGCGAIAVAAYAMLEPVLGRRRILTAFLAVCVSTLAGVLVELWEFFNFYFRGTADQGYYTNNLFDIYSNLIGALLAASIMARLAVLDGRKAAKAQKERAAQAQGVFSASSRPETLVDGDFLPEDALPGDEAAS
jgi:hypothetical protein